METASVVVPIPKSSNSQHSSPSGYRPISAQLLLLLYPQKCLYKNAIITVQVEAKLA